MAMFDITLRCRVKQSSLTLDLKRLQKLERIARSKKKSMNRVLQELLFPIVDELDEPNEK